MSPDPGTGTEGMTGSAPSTGSTQEEHSSSSEGSTTNTVSSMGMQSGQSTGPMEQPCVEGCTVELMCGKEWPSLEACVEDCEANLVEASEFEVACAAAWEDLHVCLGTLSCEEFFEWRDPTGFPYPCLPQDEVLSIECAGQ